MQSESFYWLSHHGSLFILATPYPSLLHSGTEKETEWATSFSCLLNDFSRRLVLTHRQKATRMPYFIPGRPPMHLFWTGYLRGLARVRTTQEVNFSPGNNVVLLVKLCCKARTSVCKCYRYSSLCSSTRRAMSDRASLCQFSKECADICALEERESVATVSVVVGRHWLAK